MDFTILALMMLAMQALVRMSEINYSGCTVYVY